MSRDDVAGDGESERERLIPVMASCPACGARAALRLSGWVLERVGEEDVRRRVGSYRCRRRGCGTIYEIAVAALRPP